MSGDAAPISGRRRWGRAVAVAFVGVGVLLGLVMLLESRLIYFPTRYPAGDWTLPERTREVEFEASDGVRLHGWWMTAPKAKLTVLYAHGNGGNITTRRLVLEGLRDLGMNVLAFDYRGYGRSEGSPGEAGLYLDAEAALAFLREKRIPSERVVLFGESLGAAVAAEMAVRHKTAAIILEAPFTDIPDMARKIVPIPLGWALRQRFDTLRKAPRFQAPLLVIHGSADELVPLAFGLRVFAAAPEPKRFYEVEGAHHNDISDTAGAQYFYEIAEFLSGLPD